VGYAFANPPYELSHLLSQNPAEAKRGPDTVEALSGNQLSW